jgi:hypothetical protein
MTSLLDSIAGSFTPDMIGRLGGALGTDASSVAKALGTLGPLLTAGMSRMSGAPGGAEALLGLLPDEGGTFGSFGDLLGSLFGGGTMKAGSDLMASMFGGASGAVAGTLSRALGFDVAPLVNLVAPAALGAVAAMVKGRGLDAAGLGAALKVESDAFMADPAQRETAALVDEAFEAAEAAKVRIASFGDDWAKVLAGPAAALAAVAASDLSGPLDSIREAKAAAAALEQAARAAPPGSLVATAFGAGMTSDMVKRMRALAPSRDGLIDLIRSSAAVVAARSPGDVAAYRDTVNAVARATAQASKDGGFLGIGGKPVSDDEQRALDAIAAALA